MSGSSSGRGSRLDVCGVDRRLHDAVFRLASSQRVDVARLQRVTATLLENGRDATPAEVVAALCTDLGVPVSACDDAATARLRGQLTALGARLLVAGDTDYPSPLADLWPQLGAPLWLFVGGVAPTVAADTVAVAIVGTRAPSADGVHTAHRIAGAVAAAGGVVVSGLARGIDQAAHRGALDAGGHTLAVLGTGPGCDYPRGSAVLRRRIARNGGLLTEYPPRVEPRPWRFLARNRIISGLARAVVVVEGRRRSGALQTARLAGSQGRDVWAVPGSINAPTSAAPLALLADGAIPLTSIEALLYGVGLADRGTGALQPSLPTTAAALSDEAAVVLSLLGAVPATADALAAAGTLPVRTVLTVVAELVERGLAATTARGTIRA